MAPGDGVFHFLLVLLFNIPDFHRAHRHGGGAPAGRRVGRGRPDGQALGESGHDCVEEIEIEAERGGTVNHSAFFLTFLEK